MLDGIFASLYTTSVTAPVFLAVCLLSVALGFGIALVYRKISGEGGTMVSALTVLQIEGFVQDEGAGMYGVRRRA